MNNSPCLLLETNFRYWPEMPDSGNVATASTSLGSTERTMLPTLKFLHSMRKREFLESALKHGLMLTDHEVRFNPANHFTKWQLLLDDVMPMLKAKLVAIGKPRWRLNSLSTAT